MDRVEFGGINNGIITKILKFNSVISRRLHYSKMLIGSSSVEEKNFNHYPDKVWVQILDSVIKESSTKVLLLLYIFLFFFW